MKLTLTKREARLLSKILTADVADLPVEQPPDAKKPPKGKGKGAPTELPTFIE